MIEFREFMLGLMSAPFDYAKCKKCGGVGLAAVTCCNGLECGCQGMPIDFKPCVCGLPAPPDDQIMVWFKSAHPPPQKETER